MKTTNKSILVAWIASIAFAIGIVKLTSIGKVILVISEKRGMGVHSFDLIVFIPIAICAVLTVKHLRNR